ncbi:hypothetical protein BGZ49_003822 [Haplosporangium sp. Z 27]|nr:hypothetical protein BGZ49_003822 [Haplosporangium sp. Z 27]
MAATTVLNAFSPSSKIEAIFGSKDIENFMDDFDWTKMSTKEKTTDGFVHCDLAPSFGTLNKDSIKAMDDKLKIMIAGTTREIEKLSIDQRTWENVTSIMAQNALVEPLDDGIARSDKLIKDYGSSAFKLDGSSDNNIVREVHTWFTNLIADEDVLTSTKIDIDVLGNIVGWTGATVENFETVFAKNEYHEQTLVDIGVLRYPDIEHPYFKMYRIKLTAWSDCRRVLFVQSDKNGIMGEYNVRRYRPRDSIISELKEETRKKAIQEVESLFA